MRISIDSFEPWKTLGSLLLNNKKMILGSAVVLTVAAAIYHYYQNNAANPTQKNRFPEKKDASQQSFIAANEPASPQAEKSNIISSLETKASATFAKTSVLAVNSVTGSVEEMGADSPTAKT